MVVLNDTTYIRERERERDMPQAAVSAAALVAPTGIIFPHAQCDTNLRHLMPTPVLYVV